MIHDLNISFISSVGPGPCEYHIVTVIAVRIFICLYEVTPSLTHLARHTSLLCKPTRPKFRDESVNNKDRVYDGHRSRRGHSPLIGIEIVSL